MIQFILIAAVLGLFGRMLFTPVGASLVGLGVFLYVASLF